MSDIQFYLDLGMFYFFILAISMLMLFLLIIMVLSHCRRLEQKINFIMRDEIEVYVTEKKKYKFYK